MRGSAKRNALVLLGYAAISFAYFGPRLLPHPGRVVLGSGKDPLIFVWGFAWWPHAIGDWTNPLVSHAIYAPEGYNLAWTTTVPAVAVAFSPLTLLFGPVVAYNLAAILLPALAAWTMYLLCRHVTGSTWAALVGGYLFGFSSYVLGQQLQGHLHMTAVFAIPLLALVLVRYVEGALDRRGLAWRVAALVALQLWISTELALTMTLAVAAGAALAFWRLRNARPRLRSALAPVAAGYGLALVLAAPLLVFALRDLPTRSFTSPRSGTTDAANLLFPTDVNALGDTSFGSPADGLNTTEAALYLGLPTLLIVILFAWRERRRRVAQVLVAALVLPLLVALGPVLLVHGRELLTLPWTLAHHVPGLENVRLPRLALYATLAAGLIVALWIARTKGRIYPRPFVLPVLAVAALVPALDRPLYLDHVDRPAFFAENVYRSCLGPGENVAIFPYGRAGDSMLWQAESDFRFRLAGGYVYPLVFGGPTMTRFDDDPVVRTLNFSDRSLPTTTSLLAFADRHRIDRFVAADAAAYPSATQMRSLGPVQQIGGVRVAPACGTPPLTSRDLSRYVEADRRNAGTTIAYCFDGNTYDLPAGEYPAGILAGATPDFVINPGSGCAPAPPSRAGG